MSKQCFITPEGEVIRYENGEHLRVLVINHVMKKANIKDPGTVDAFIDMHLIPGDIYYTYATLFKLAILIPEENDVIVKTHSSMTKVQIKKLAEVLEVKDEQK